MYIPPNLSLISNACSNRCKKSSCMLCIVLHTETGMVPQAAMQLGSSLWSEFDHQLLVAMYMHVANIADWSPYRQAASQI